MKTSNKILGAFFIIIFLIPLFILMSFNSQIRKGEFTVVKNENGLGERRSAISAYKVIKIKGPAKEHVFSCTISAADSAYYEYPDYYGQNNIKVEQQGDTLWVRYIGTVTDENFQGTKHSSINLRLPQMDNIVIDGADVFIDSVSYQASPVIFARLFNRASLEFGRMAKAKSAKVDTASPSTIGGKGMVNALRIEADDATVTVGPNAQVANLDIQIHGDSRINIDNNSRIDNVSGFISDSSTVGANWKNMRKLARLAN